MRFVRFWSLIVVLAIGLGAECCAADETGMTAQHHPWARFEPGAWKRVRVVTETLDEQGTVTSTSTTETKTSLVRVEQNAVDLEVEVSVEVAGKRFEGQPQCIRQGFNGEVVGPDMKIKSSQPRPP